MGRVIHQKGPRVIPAEVATATEEARVRIHSAEQRATAIKDRAQEAASDIRQRAHDAGKRKGEKAALQMLFQSQQLHAAALHAQRGELQEAVIQCSTYLAKRIMGERIQTSSAASQHAEELVDKLLERIVATHSPSIVLHVHPQDVESTMRAVARSTPTLAVETVGDKRIEPGGCLAIGSYATFDARVSTQLQRLKDTLLALPLKQNEGKA